MRTFILWFLLAGSAFANSYSTNFPGGEMASDRWIQGHSTGSNWSNVANTPGFAFGTQSGGQLYNDSIAVVAGSWGNDQAAQAVVSIPSVPASVAEVELHLRSTIQPGRITGYEFNGSVSPNGGAYMQIVRWNGPLANFTGLAAAGLLLHSGDVLMAKAQGNVLTLYRNGVAVCTASDSTFSSGAPGIGMYNNGASNNTGYGLASFSATDNGSAPPVATPTPTSPVVAPYIAWESSLENELRSIGIGNSQINSLSQWLLTHPPAP